jgi:hypothetical protein
MTVEDQSQPSQFRQFLPSVSEETIGELLREDLGQASFVGVATPLRAIRDLLEEAIPQEENLPSQRLAQAVAQLNQLAPLQERIRSFNLETSNPLQARDGLVTEVVNLKDQVIEGVRPYLRGDAAALARKVELLTQTLETARKDNERLEALVRQTRQGQVNIASEHASAFYDEQATKHDGQAKNFLWAVIGFSILLAVIAGVELIWAYTHPGEFTSTADAITAAIPRLTVLVLVSFAVGFSARNYRINRHLAVLNRTKALTIQTADRYAAAVDEPNHRDMVVSSLVTAVFTIGDTGYLPVDSERTIIETPGAAGMISAMAPKSSG